MKTDESVELAALFRRIKTLAKEYYALTGRPLGCTGEVAEYEAVRLLGLEAAEVRQSGYDAVRRSGGEVTRIQVKGRRVADRSKSGQRMGRLDLKKDFDTVMLVLLDGEFSATAIYEATREAVSQALSAPGSKSRNERGALSTSKFRSIAKKIWPPV